MYQVQRNNAVGEEGTFRFKKYAKKMWRFTERRDFDFISAWENTKANSGRMVINYFSLENFRNILYFENKER
jgi:hypothetical protein